METVCTMLERSEETSRTELRVLPCKQANKELREELLYATLRAADNCRLVVDRSRCPTALFLIALWRGER